MHRARVLVAALTVVGASCTSASGGVATPTSAAPSTGPSSTATTTTTAAPGTTASTSSTTPSTTMIDGEVIPGFPATDSLEVFEQQVRANPVIIGAAGQDLAAALRSIFAEPSNRTQRQMAKTLSAQLHTWVADGQLNAQIADALDQLLAPLVAKAK